jgi:pyruvate dehydrogenase E2 component (dihydrolipoamide acetyltransferase)
LQDLRAFIQRLTKSPSKKSPSEKKEPDPSIDFSQWGPVTKEPMSELRKAISRRMTESTSTIPRVTQFDSIDITDLDALRQKHASKWKEENAPLTPTVFAIAAVVAALKKHPLFRSSLDEASEEIVLKDYYHIGIAVDTNSGLMVPVIRDADLKSLAQLARELVEKATLTRDRKLKSEDMKGGVFTISNQGGIGGGHFTPVINKPESAILGIGRSQLQPAVVDGKIEPRLLMPVAISYDHRLIDGAEAARFTVSLGEAFHQISEKDLTTR